MRKNDRLFFMFGILMLASEIWKQWCLTYIVNHGTYDWWYFPFQLCSIPMYVCLLAPWVKNEALYNAMMSFLMDFGLLGGIFTFFDTSGMHYPYLPLTIHSFLWHFTLIFLGLTAGWKHAASASWKSYRQCVYIYVFCCCIATVLNVSVNNPAGINMFFINPYYKMSQVVFRNISHAFGTPIGIFVYIAACILGAALFHLIWKTLDHYRKHDRCC